MEGQDVVSSDDHKIGTIVAEQDGFAIVEMGHVFKTKHAVPTEFLHEFEGVQRATVSKELVSDSPKIEDDQIDAAAVKMHYGLVEVTLVDPDPDDMNAEVDDPRRTHAANDAPAFDNTTNSADPGWTPAGTSSRDPQRDDALDRDRQLGEPG
jgi:hypothetical protein